MGLLKRYRTAIIRRRRSAGFGIHSPFAYRFVTQVLRERCHYYAYDDIRAWRRRLLSDGVRPMMSEHEAQMLFRMANFFAPQQVFQVGLGGILPIVTMLLASSKTKASFYDEPDRRHETCEILSEHFDRQRIHPMSDIHYSPSDELPKPFILINSLPGGEKAYQPLCDLLHKWLSDNELCIVTIRNLHRNPSMQRLWLSAKSSMTYGQTFTNDKTAILVANPKLQREDFSLWL